MTSPLQGGKKRRHTFRPQAFAVAALLLAALAIAFVLLANEGRVDSGGGAPAAAPRTVQPAARPKPPPLLNGRLPIQAPPGIELTGSNVVRVHLSPKPAAALLFDLDSGRVLWRLHPLQIRPIASLTKMMTALLVVERLPVDAKALISKAALPTPGRRWACCRAGSGSR